MQVEHQKPTWKAHGIGRDRRASFGTAEKQQFSYDFDPNLETSTTNDAVFGDVSNGPNYRAVCMVVLLVLEKH